MDALLPLDINSPSWHVVRDYAEARISILTAECIDLSTAPERRFELSARIAELRELLQAPATTRRTAEMAESTTRSIY